METEKEGQVAEMEATRAELEELRREKGVLAGEIEARDSTIARLEQAVAGRDGEIATLKQALADSDKKLSELSNALSQAVASYKEMVIKLNPGVLAELITGDTIEEVDESLKNAQALVERVWQEMEAEASRTTVPAGAPPRAPLDLSALSAREKIQYAIGGFSSRSG